MKKRLLHLVRHAKSDWSTPGQRDFERTLNARGRHDAPIIAKRLFSNFPSPKVFHVSTAQRTRETAEQFYKAYADKIITTHFHQELYHASEGVLMEFVSLLPNSEIEVVIFTHNNGVSEFASRLSLQNLDMPTCAIATFELDDDWKNIRPEACVLRHYDYPKKHE